MVTVRTYEDPGITRTQRTEPSQDEQAIAEHYSQAEYDYFCKHESFDSVMTISSIERVNRRYDRVTVRTAMYMPDGVYKRVVVNVLEKSVLVRRNHDLVFGAVHVGCKRKIFSGEVTYLIQ